MAVLAMAFAAALAAGGCTIFPKGAYWPAYDRHLRAEAPAGERRDGAPADLAERLRRAVALRWTDESLAQSARSMDAAHARYVYGDVLGVIVACYVDRVTYGGLVAAGLESLRVALDDEAFRARFGADDAEKRKIFSDSLDVLILKARAADPWFAFQAQQWLDVAMEKNRAMLGLPDGAVAAEMLFGALDSLDPYTRFMTPEMERAYDEQAHGRYVGIGTEVDVRDGRARLGEVFAGGPADKAGLARGDEIVSIDDRPVSGLAPGEVARGLRGEAGTTVRLNVRKGGAGDGIEVTLTRGPVHLPAVRDAQILPGDDAVGYVRLTSFNSASDKDLRRAVAGLAAKGARRLILDLRGNPGGSLLEGVGAAAVFLGDGRVIRTCGRLPGATWTYDVPLGSRPAWDGPLAILMDGDTASAAELLAAALARRGRATLVGARTFGKGAVQIPVPVSWGAGTVVVTIARVYGPDGACLEGDGLSPDVPVPAPAADAPRPASPGDDDAVRAALRATATRDDASDL
jgi:carboxyl-terminal processing protease